MTAPGAVWDGRGVRFSLFSAHAEAVELCLFDPSDPGGLEARRVPMERGADGVWTADLPGAGPGLAYGYRVHGRFAPHEGHRFNPAKLLVDPRAAAIHGRLAWSPALRGSPAGQEDHRADGDDSAPFVPRALVVDPAFDWQDDRPPRTSWSDTVIYECHVRGLTRLHPELPQELRGTYAGLAEPVVVEHLKRLGVTAVELLPVQHHVPELHLLTRGLTNYFGYSPLGFFAPHASYAAAGAAGAVHEFREMVRTLHRAGLEVLLDVVFNHTPEGDHQGPTLSLRGIDNRAYYRLAQHPGRYRDDTGCGNTLDLERPPGRTLVIDCLRYWVEEMHVDGFRFDLATTLGRGERGFSASAPLFESLAADPVMRGVKLIAEPWDVGRDGYQLGSFPDRWSEWNDRYRDSVRSFWRGDAGSAPALRRALAGNPEVFAPRRPASASISFVTCHDGFTLADLVSYEHKRNWANGEDNRDGHNHNLSRNWGVEGPTDQEPVRHLRRRVERSLLGTLALSRGVPMLNHGDEMERSQDGNNNAYCQDNETAWVHWPETAGGGALEEFLARALALRRRHAALRPGPYPEPESIRWLSLDGGPLSAVEAGRPCFAALWPDGSDPLLALFNGGPVERLFRLPGLPAEGRWRLALSSAHGGDRIVPGGSLLSAPHSLTVLRRVLSGPYSSESAVDVSSIDSDPSDASGPSAPSESAARSRSTR